MALRAIIFDFDGLILDTETPEVRAWQKIFREHQLEYPDSNWINAIGRGADQIAETPLQLLDRLLPSPLDHALVRAQYEQLRMSVIEVEEALPGVRDLIAEAKNAGLRLAVASSSKRSWVERHLKRLGLFELFDAVFCREDVLLAKPAPDLYLLACEKLGVTAEEAVAIEDSPNGVRAARDAGLYCVAVPNDCTKFLNLNHASRQVLSLVEVNLQYLSEWMAEDTTMLIQAPETMNEKSKAIHQKAQESISLMQAEGIWDIEAPTPEAFENMGAFGSQTMAFEQWLRYVLLARVEEALQTDGPWPGSSSVGAYAARELDGAPYGPELTRVLSEFDRLF